MATRWRPPLSGSPKPQGKAQGRFLSLTFDESFESYCFKNLDSQSRRGLRSLVSPCFTDDAEVQWG